MISILLSILHINIFYFVHLLDSTSACLIKLLTGYWQFIFPAEHKPLKMMSENAILSAIKRMGYQGRATGHGFRHTGSTILNEQGFRSDLIEVSLAHTDKDTIRGTYNHATYIEERRKMMQWRGDYLGGALTNKNM